MRALREDLTRRTGRETALVDDAERPVPLNFSWSVEPLHELLEELVRVDQVPAYIVHFTQASALSTAQSLLSAKLCTREERNAIADVIGAFRFTAGLRQDALQARARGDRRPPRGHAAALPAARRAARADRAAEGDLRHRHAGRRHQRPDPDGRLHRPGEVRRHQPPAAEGARVPPDRGPRGPRRVRHHGLRVVQAPEHTIENARRVAKAADDQKKPSACRRSRRPRAS